MRIFLLAVSFHSGLGASAGAEPGRRAVIVHKGVPAGDVSLSDLRKIVLKVFRAETLAAPKMVSSTQAAGDLVRQIPGAIAVVDAAQVPAGVKVLRVDGRSAGHPGYPLR